MLGEAYQVQGYSKNKSELYQSKTAKKYLEDLVDGDVILADLHLTSEEEEEPNHTETL